MNFNRTFNLTEYWSKWKEQVTEKRGVSQSTEWIEVDNVRCPFGGQIVVIPPEHIDKFIKEDLQKIYHRDNLALKVFHNCPQPMEMSIYMCFWGSYIQGDGERLSAVSKIQNWFAAEYLAPRVYDLIWLARDGIKYPAQVTDYIGGEMLADKRDEELDRKVRLLNAFADTLGILPQDIASSNFKGGKLLDFQRFVFRPPFRTNLIERIKEGLGFGDGTPYQSVEELNIFGKRNNLERYKILAPVIKNDIKRLPKNFTVLDFGCNGAFFLRRAFDWGAGYGVGVDRKSVMMTAREITNYLGYFNADFFTELPEGKFDMAFYLSMDIHFPFEDFVKSVGKVLYLEGHSKHPKEKYFEMLKPHFKQVDLLGGTTDFGGERLLFRAIK
jgi:hypothetical protein